MSDTPFIPSAVRSTAPTPSSARVPTAAHAIPPDSAPNRPPEPELELLDPASLHTVLTMLEVIDTVEELALLESLTPAQKRQVWEATSVATRDRLKQLRAGQSLGQPASPTVEQAAIGEPATHALVSLETVNPGRGNPVSIEPLDLARDRSPQSAQPDWPETDLTAHLTEPPLTQSVLIEAIEAADLAPEPNRTIEETAAIDLAAQQEEINLMLQEPLNLDAHPTVAVGDWIILQAKPRLTRAELMAIWEVVEVQGNYARILAEGLGTRIYPAAWMLLYPKPIDYAEPEF